ncbi:hypothetical protein AB28_5300 [Raoultella ornithinolytica 2-156-04_S1_C2]|nr:hypothetical protein AB00_5308 [Raoultella ornithinolytica 2-156-04_S1_C1]KDX08820.1 hypothetical protein AB28_5300 [Raoultella ornithinolytica 2-156-04_S1_C2]
MGGEWVKYNKIDGSANFSTSVDSTYRGNGYNLSNFFSVYDWIKNDGYNNFSSWLK